MGDSMTNGARNEYYRNYTLELSNLIFSKKKINNICINESINGETSSEILIRAIKLLSKKRYNYVLIFLGTNDIKVPIPLNIFSLNIEQIIRLSKLKKNRLSFCLIPPIYTGLPAYSKKTGNELIKKYNKIIKEKSKKNNIKICDISKLDEKFYLDGVHLNYLGDLEIAKKWFNLIKNEI